MLEPGEVKAARNRAGLTQQQLADILGVHVKTLRDFEKGKRARLRAGQAKLADFVAAHPEPEKTGPPPAPTAALRPLAEASDMELIAVLTARLALLRAAVDGPIPAAVEMPAPTVVVQTVVAPAPNVSPVAANSTTPQLASVSPDGAPAAVAAMRSTTIVPPTESTTSTSGRSVRPDSPPTADGAAEQTEPVPPA